MEASDWVKLIWTLGSIACFSWIVLTFFGMAERVQRIEKVLVYLTKLAEDEIERRMDEEDSRG